MTVPWWMVPVSVMVGAAAAVAINLVVMKRILKDSVSKAFDLGHDATLDEMLYVAKTYAPENMLLEAAVRRMRRKEEQSDGPRPDR
jgi:hypothetical protein